MANITLKTLTPLHIGSGRLLQDNSEFIFFKDRREIAIVDERKVLDIVGEENIQIWIDCIEGRKDFLSYLKQRKSNLLPADMSFRVLTLKGDVFPKASSALREHIRTGLGTVYLPGSSLKGAIRTAIFASALKDKKNPITNFEVTKQNRSGKTNYSDSGLSKGIFGSDPNHDWLRLIQIGDFHFEEGVTEAVVSQTLNELNDENFDMKREGETLLEFVPQNKTAKGSISIPKHLQKQTLQANTFKRPTGGNLDASNLSYQTLCNTVNKHFLRLVRAEINRFADFVHDFPNDASEFIDSLKEIETFLNNPEPNTCFVRVGFGTGYLNMTGDWISDKNLVDDELYENIAAAARKDFRRKYEGYPMPKSRRMLLDGIPMGWVKLTFNI